MAAVGCTGEEFGTTSGKGGDGTSTSSITSTSGGGGDGPGTSSASTGTIGEGGSAVTTSGGGGEGGGGSQGGGGSGPVGDCDPELSGELPIPASCGIFVDPNRPEGEVGQGTREQPFRNLNDAVAAVALTDERRIYVTESMTSEHVIIDVEGIIVHGGMTSDFRFRADGRTHVVQPAGDPNVAAVVVRNTVADVTLRGMRIEGKTTSAPGESSVGLLLEQATVRLGRSEVIAHDAADGASGEMPTSDIGPTDAPSDPDLAGAPGNPQPVNGTSGGPGGLGGVNRRPGCDSRGGRGGTGASSLSLGGDYAAGDGQAGETGGERSGAGGEGAEVSDGVLDDCGNGQPSPVWPENGEAGASATGPGTIVPELGFIHAVATGGTRGATGPAGGGGGGGRRQPERGWGGGGGGAGGCGGFGAPPGQSGGSSIGVMAFDGDLYLDEGVSISAGSGGDGGDSADGQPGAPGGLGGANPANLACSGGAGRRGGAGGPGGAGAGGHSLGVAHTGTTVVGEATFSLSAAGEAGESVVAPADDGIVFESYEF